MVNIINIDRIKLINIEELKPYKNNPKKHPKEQINKIAESISEFGFTIPIVIKNNEIISGHGRYLAAKQLGLKEILVIERDDLTELQAKAFRIADNRVAEETWDINILSDEIKYLESNHFNLEKLGFSEDELKTFNIKDIGDLKNDAYAEWNASAPIPYENENKNGIKTILIHFLTEQDIQDFADLIGQNITEKTKYLWFPKQNLDVIKDLRYVPDDVWEKQDDS